MAAARARVAVALLCLSAAGGSSQTWKNPEGRPLPFQSDDEIVAFLRTAEIVSSERLTTGRTRPRRVVLQKEGVRARAIFREARTRRGRRQAGRRWIFRDDYAFECAAFELSRRLGLDNLPPAVLRVVEGREGSLQIWLEGAMTENERRRNRVEIPDRAEWDRQLDAIRVFDYLINNEDRSYANLLIDSDWRIWMIDHTRAFAPVRTEEMREQDEDLERCPRALWEKLRTLDPERVAAALSPYLNREEVEALRSRWGGLVSRIDRLILQKGEGAVLY